MATCTGATARSIAVLGHGEPGASLGRALAQLAETLEKVEVIRRAQSNSDLYQFGEMLRDYVALIGAIKVSNQFTSECRPFAFHRFQIILSILGCVPRTSESLSKLATRSNAVE